MHHEAAENARNSCQLIPTKIKLKRVEQINGSSRIIIIIFNFI